MEFSASILLFTYICCFENKLPNFLEKIFFRNMEKNVPPEKRKKTCCLQEAKKVRKEKGRGNLKGFKISTLHGAEISTVPSQI